MCVTYLNILQKCGSIDVWRNKRIINLPREREPAYVGGGCGSTPDPITLRNRQERELFLERYDQRFSMENRAYLQERGFEERTGRPQVKTLNRPYFSFQTYSPHLQTDSNGSSCFLWLNPEKHSLEALVGGMLEAAVSMKEHPPSFDYHTPAGQAFLAYVMDRKWDPLVKELVRRYPSQEK